MPVQNPTGSRPQALSRQTGTQSQRLPNIKANINWLNTKDDSNIRATASLNIGGLFAVHGVKIINGSKGEFVSMPSYKSGDNYKEIFHATTAESRQQMNDAVLTAYEQKLAEQNQGGEFYNNGYEQTENTGTDSLRHENESGDASFHMQGMKQQ